MFYLRGEEHPFARSIVNACMDCESEIPGFAVAMLDRIAAIGGRDWSKADYQQLLSVLNVASLPVDFLLAP